MSTPFLIVAADFVKTGGMDRANYALADYAARQGLELHLVGHHLGGGLRDHSNVRWHPVARPLGRDALGWGALSRAGRRWARRITASGGHVLVNGGNCPWPDLNWVHYVHAAYHAPTAGGAARQAWHGLKHRRARHDEARALRRARVVIANSEATRQALLALLELDPERVHTLYYGCDAERFRPATQEERAAARQALGWAREGRTALFLGALGDRRKGFDTLFSAWRALSRDGSWPLQLAIAGRGAEVHAWQRRAQQAGLGAHLHFLGFRTDVPRLLAASDLLISPTRYEAFGLGVQEALATGLPVVVSAAAGVAERMPPALAPLLLHDPDSPVELEGRLRWWLDHAAELAPSLQALGQKLRAASWDQMAARILSLAVRS